MWLQVSKSQIANEHPNSPPTLLLSECTKKITKVKPQSSYWTIVLTYYVWRRKTKHCDAICLTYVRLRTEIEADPERQEITLLGLLNLTLRRPRHPLLIYCSSVTAYVVKFLVIAPQVFYARVACRIVVDFWYASRSRSWPVAHISVVHWRVVQYRI